MSDRKIHARTAPHPSRNALVIVRYDRGGKWYIEMEATHDTIPPGRRCAPEPIPVSEAAVIAEKWEARGGTVFEGTPGGQVFDRKVRALRSSRVQGRLNRANERAARKAGAK